jgi:tetratricopeptide (TPR) repeat protein
LVALGVCAALIAGHTRIDSQRHFAGTQRYEDIYYLPPPGWLQAFSLGYREATAGLIWLRTLIYFGDELAHRGNVANLSHYADAMLALDPYFKRVYRWIATCGVYRTGHVGPEHVRKSISYLERAARLFPDDGEIAWDLAAFYLYELRPLTQDPAEKESARRKGVEHLQFATLRGAGPPWLVLNAAGELEKLGQRERQIAFLQEAYGQVADENIREQIHNRIATLQSATFAEALAREYEEVETARARDFPYLELELFLQIGKKPAFDGTALLLRGFAPDGLFDEPELEPDLEPETDPLLR